jgi:hypothetical protein
MELGAETTLERIEERPAGKRVQVGRGAILVEAAHQPQGRAITLVTPHGEARIVGTVLHLNVDPAATRLEVMEGKVELTRAGAGTIDVYSGFVAVAAPGVELAARPSARMLVEPLHRYDFKDGRLPRAFAKGIVEKGPENRLCLAGEILSNATSGGHVQLSEDAKDAKGLFTYTDDLVLSFDYWVDSTVRTLDLHVWSRAQQVSFGTTVWNTPNERWVHVVLRLADFLHGEADHLFRLRPGENVPNLWIQAGQAGGRLFLDNLELARVRPLPPRKKDETRK